MTECISSSRHPHHGIEFTLLSHKSISHWFICFISDDDDEFDNYDLHSPTVLGQCRAIYDYAASQYDELTIKPGKVFLSAKSSRICPSKPEIGNFHVSSRFHPMSVGWNLGSPWTFAASEPWNLYRFVSYLQESVPKCFSPSFLSWLVSGDIISIYDKQDDGWWQGELNGRVGIFPSTYVEEVAGESHS